MRTIATALGAMLLFSGAALAEDTNMPTRLIVQAGDAAITCSTAASAGEICSEGDIEIQGNLATAGTSTLTGAAALGSTLSVAGATTLNGTLTMGTSDDIDLSANQLRAVLVDYTDKTENYTVTTDDCGAVLVTNDDNRVLTLPDAAAANKGCVVTFINIAADDAALISIDPHSSDGINGGCCYVKDDATVLCAKMAGTANKDLQNTKAEQNLGDHVTVVSDGSAGWYITSCYGSWVTES